MGISFNKVEVNIDLGWIRDNYRTLCRRCSNPFPVIKADAYGHGLVEVAGVLADAGATTLCAGSVEEACALREVFGGRILSLLGALDGEDARLAAENGIVCFCGRDEQLRALAAAAKQCGKEVGVALKFDTGMGRLGFGAEDVPAIAETLGELDGVHVVLACSHLATADEPEKEEYVRQQQRKFEDTRAALAQSGLHPAFCIANSAASLGFPDLGYDAQRPGIALYGVNPFYGTSRAKECEGLAPAMSVSAPVLQVHDLPKGSCLSYGCTFTAPRDMRVAFVGAGYADAYSRGLSGKGQMSLHGRRAKVLGRVCMQLTGIDVTDIPDVHPGDRAWLLGGDGDSRITPEELAGWWGTIAYEVFCLLGMNPRIYHGR